MTWLERPAANEAPANAFIAPASLAQSRYWHAIERDPTISSLNVSMQWRLDGDIRDETVEQAFQLLVERHETLRTAFGESDGVVEQKICDDVPFKLSVIDLTRLPAGRRESEATAIGAREALRLFNLRSPPLLRATLLRLTDSCAILVVTVHHLVTDGWSMGLLAREFATIASALESGQKVSLPELPMQYADFSLWQKEVLATAAMDEDVSYWRSQLRQMPSFTLPPQRERPIEPKAIGAIRSLLLDRTLTDRLEAIAREQGYSFFVTMLAALAACLHTVTRKNEIVIGTQVAGREHSDLHNIVGPFVNAVALRINAEGEDVLGDFVQALSIVVKDAMSHERLPCELIMDRLPWPDHKGRAYVCPINFSFERAFVETKRYGNFELVSLPSQSAGALFDLSFFAVLRPDGWRISCEANTDLYDADVANHLIALWQNALRAIAETPALSLGSCVTGPALVALKSIFSDPQGESVPGSDARQPGDAPKPTATVPEAQFPASLLQCKLWKADQLKPGDPTLNISARWALNGPVDEAQLNRALNLIVGRQQALRTSFAERDGKLLQIVHPEVHAQVRVIDLTRRSEDERRSMLEEAGSSEAKAPFDLRTAPLLRLTLFLLSENEAQLLLTTHHMISDCWSGGIFARELAQIYSAIAQGRDPQIEPLTLEYGEYGTQLETWIDGGNGLASERYWLRRLDGMTSVFMPSDNPLPEFPTSRGALHVEELPQTLIDAVECATRSQGVTFFMVGVAALAATLRQWTGSDEVIFSTQVSGRDQPALERPIGPFCNWLALRHHLKGAMRLKDVLAQVRDTVADALEYKQLPIDHIEERLELRGIHRRRSPLRAVNFLVLGNLSRDADAGAFRLRGVPGCSSGTKYDLNVFIMHLAEGWRISCEFDPDLFNQATIAKVVQSFSVALGAFATEPDRQLSSLSLAIETNYAPSHDLKDGQAVTRRPAPSTDHPADHAQDATQGAPTVPAGDMTARMLEIWASVLSQSHVSADQSFFELGGDSLAAAKLIARVNSEFETTATLSALFRAPTVRTFMDALRPDRTPAPGSDPRIIEVATSGSGTPVIGINNSLILHALSERLGRDRPMLAIKYFESEAERTLPSRGLEDIAADYIALIRNVRPHGPYVLFGLCVHGVLAIEIARQLRDAGERVPLVVVEDCWEPQFIRSLTHAQRWRVRLHDLALHLEAWRRGDMDFAQLLALYSIVRRSKVLDLAVRIGLIDRIPAKTGNAESDWWLQHLMDARNRYQCRPYDGDVMMFVSDDVPKGWQFDPTIGWSGVVRGYLEVIGVSGHHGALGEGSGARTFAHSLRRALDQIDLRSGSPPAIH